MSVTDGSGRASVLREVVCRDLAVSRYCTLSIATTNKRGAVVPSSRLVDQISLDELQMNGCIAPAWVQRTRQSSRTAEGSTSATWVTAHSRPQGQEGDLSPPLLTVAGKIDENGQSSTMDSEVHVGSDRRFLPLATRVSSSCTIRGRYGWAAQDTPLGIAIDWVVDRSSLISANVRDGLMYSQAIVRIKGSERCSVPNATLKRRPW